MFSNSFATFLVFFFLKFTLVEITLTFFLTIDSKNIALLEDVNQIIRYLNQVLQMLDVNVTILL